MVPARKRWRLARIYSRIYRPQSRRLFYKTLREWHQLVKIVAREHLPHQVAQVLRLLVASCRLTRRCLTGLRHLLVWLAYNSKHIPVAIEHLSSISSTFPSQQMSQVLSSTLKLLATSLELMAHMISSKSNELKPTVDASATTLPQRMFTTVQQIVNAPFSAATFLLLSMSGSAKTSPSAPAIEQPTPAETQFVEETYISHKEEPPQKDSIVDEPGQPVFHQLLATTSKFVSSPKKLIVSTINLISPTAKPEPETLNDSQEEPSKDSLSAVPVCTAPSVVSTPESETSTTSRIISKPKRFLTSTINLINASQEQLHSLLLLHKLRMTENERGEPTESSTIEDDLCSETAAADHLLEPTVLQDILETPTTTSKIISRPKQLLTSTINLISSPQEQLQNLLLIAKFRASHSAQEDASHALMDTSDVVDQSVNDDLEKSVVQNQLAPSSPLVSQPKKLLSAAVATGSVQQLLDTTSRFIPTYLMQMTASP